MPDLLIEMHRQNMQLGQIMHFRRCHTHSFWISTALAALGYLIGSLLTRHLAIQLSTEWQTSKEATKDWLGLDSWGLSSVSDCLTAWSLSVSAMRAYISRYLPCHQPNWIRQKMPESNPSSSFLPVAKIVKTTYKSTVREKPLHHSRGAHVAVSWYKRGSIGIYVPSSKVDIYLFHLH
jgi:hypothetical protein